MGLQLESVELKNIRSQSNFLLEPKKKGITVISGENGTGKSTIVNSISWALFGTKPKGVNKIKSLMKDGVKFKKGDFYVEVILKIDEEYLKVKRSFVTRAGKVECDVWRSTDKNNWTHEAGPSVSHTEPYIRKSLKIDEKGFLSAIFVQQKQVDQLITSTPKERAEVIEKLTGVSSVTKAITEARAEYNATKKIVDKTDIDVEELEDLKKEKSIKKKLVNDLKNRINIKRKELEVEEKEISTLSSRVSENERNLDQYKELESLIEVEKNRLSIRKDSLERLITEKDSKKSKLNITYQTSDLDDIKSELRDKNNNLKNIVSESIKLDIIIKEMLEEEKLYEEILNKTNIKTLDELNSRREDNLINIRKMEKLEKVTEDEIYSSQALIKNLNNAITVITSNKGSCPTCLQKVKDVKHVVDVLEEQCSVTKSSIVENKNKLNFLNEHLNKAIENNEKFETLSKAFNLEEIRKEREKLEQDKLQLEVSERLENDAIEVLQKKLAESKNYQEIRDDYKRVLAQAQEETEIVEKLENSLIKKTEQLSKFNLPSVSVIKSDRRSLDKRIAEFNIDKQNFIKDEGTLILEQERLNFLDKEITTLQGEYDRYKEMLRAVEVGLNTIKVLEEFREDRIVKSVPVIESYASEFLSSFTDNMFSAIELDSNFNTTVVLPNGDRREVGLLSGGELSTAALSLRLAITFLLGTDDNNLLILDEVLVSQDKDRVQSILNTIKKVFKGQVVLIAHNDSIKEIADRVVELK